MKNFTIPSIYTLLLSFFLYSNSAKAQCGSTINVFPYNESFENFGFGGLGAWQQDLTDGGDWTVSSFGTGSPGTGPNGASNLLYYLYTEASSGQNPGNPNITAFINSPCFNLASLANPTFTFDYHMYGASMGTLKVQVSTDNGTSWSDIGWSQTGQVQTSTTDAWNTVMIDLNAYSGQTIKLRFHGTTGTGYQSDMAIDNIVVEDFVPPLCTSNVIAFPYNEGFEGIGSGGLGLWSQNTIDDGGDWTINSGGTASGGTGPSTADEGSYYLYTETSSGTNPGANSSAYLESPCFNLSTLSYPEFNFSYHMFGANMGNLKVQVSTNNGFSFSDIGWSRNGQQHNSNVDPWSSANIDLGSYAGQTIILRFHASTGTNYTSDMAIDKVSLVEGTAPIPLTEGPGGITEDLALWLKGTNGLSYTDGQSVSLWEDQGRGGDATVNTTGQEPTYRDNVSHNINFNPVVEFDNVYASYTLDGDFSYDDTSTQFLEGSSGMFTQELFIVLIPDETPINNSFGFMDVFCGDASPSTDEEDATGLGFGDYSGRISGESISYAYSTFNNSIAGDGYAVHDGPTGGTYRNVGIINARNNSAATQQELYYNANNIEANQNDIPAFQNVNDSRFWLGRSEGWEASLNARVGEVISFSSRLSDSDLTDERNRVQSYLAIKYGITLGINGTSQDYVNSNGDVIWNQSVNSGYNFDIAGIGRDDDSNLNQKQSRSINNAADGIGRTEGILTMGLTNIYDTNNLNKTTNTNTINDQNYLVWGNNNASLDAAPVTVAVDMSSGISGLSTPVSFLGMQRIWKVVETGGDIGRVELSIPQAAIRNISPPGSYYMFISDTPIFDPTADYRLMTSNGANLETSYDFDGTKYITFGYAPQTIVERSIYFDGTQDYIDIDDALNLNSSGFTVSAWIKTDGNTNNTSILSKRNTAYTEGYDFKINVLGRAEMSWGLLGSQSIRSSISIPENEWHQIAVTYNGTSARMYIDGVLDSTETLPAPTPTNQSFFIAAAGKNAPTSHFRGNIDEVRVWDTALSLDQLRFIMNQEIADNTAFVSGKILPTTITKNEVASLPWSDLAGYYPMSIYTYTNTEDESGNGNQGALRNLNTVDFQTAPLPYRSASNGNWNTNATWTNGNVQTIPGTNSIVDNTVTVDWNIVETSHNISIVNSTLPAANNNERQVLALNVLSNTLTINGDTATNDGNAIKVTHYLNLDGKIDLEGESQLLQSLDSDLDATSSGTLERDQQGTQDRYTYNYWASPVGLSNTSTNNNNYTIPQVFKDGTNAVAPVNINFITNSYDGSAGSPIGIADYWIWKFGNLGNNYYNWQHVRSTGSLRAGEGFTMKGIADTSGNVLLEQNYVLEGKPHNGEITLPIDPANEYLVGNPYASAIDANIFILDNMSTTGTLYFWEHWGGGTHVTTEYQGGYATYNLSGATPAMQFDFATGGNTGTSAANKLPGRYIPVSQGFFVTGGASSGNIVFNNNQRVFQKEGVNSTFIRSSNNNQTTTNDIEDNRMKIRLSLSSASTFKRQLLVTVDSNASAQIDFGYDGETNEVHKDDMYWMIDSRKFTIQGIDTIDANTILPLGLHTDINGINTFKIDELINVPTDLEIYIFDNVTGTYHDIKFNPDFSINLPAGSYTDRFELRFFNGNSLSTDEFVAEETGIQFYFANNNESIVINNPELQPIKSVALINMLGQTIVSFDAIETQNYTTLKTTNLSTGNYILNIKTDIGKISKKVLVE